MERSISAATPYCAGGRRLCQPRALQAARLSVSRLHTDVDAVVCLAQLGVWVLRGRSQRQRKRQARHALRQRPRRRHLLARHGPGALHVRRVARPPQRVNVRVFCALRRPHGGAAASRASTVSFNSEIGRTLRKNASKTPTARSLTRIDTDPEAHTRMPECCTPPAPQETTTSPSRSSPAWYTRSLRLSFTSTLIACAGVSELAFGAAKPRQRARELRCWRAVGAGQERESAAVQEGVASGIAVPATGPRLSSALPARVAG